MERTPEPNQNQDQGTSQPTRRFGGARLRPRATPIPRTVTGTEASHPTQTDPALSEDTLLTGEAPPGQSGGPFAPRGLAGGRIQVIGFPGCLVVSVVLSLILTLLLNALL